MLVEELPTGDAVAAQLAACKGFVHLYEPNLGADNPAGDMTNDLIDPAVGPKLQGIPVAGERKCIPRGVGFPQSQAASGDAEMKLCIMIVDREGLFKTGHGVCQVTRCFELSTLPAQGLPLLSLRWRESLAMERPQRRTIPQVHADRRDHHQARREAADNGHARRGADPVGGHMAAVDVERDVGRGSVGSDGDE